MFVLCIFVQRRFLHAFRCEVRLQNREKDLYDAVIAFISRQKMVRSAVLLAEKKKVRYSWSERVKQWATGEDPKPELELKPDNAQVRERPPLHGGKFTAYSS